MSREELVAEDEAFLAAIQNEENRRQVISILKYAGLIPECQDQHA